jgi:hypothetical protein
MRCAPGLSAVPFFAARKLDTTVSRTLCKVTLDMQRILLGDRSVAAAAAGAHVAWVTMTPSNSKEYVAIAL